MPAPSPELRPLLVLEVLIDPPVIIDESAGRRFIRITGGTVSGRYSGKVQNSGGDWQIGRGAGITELSAHYVLDIDGHGLVEVSAEGLRRADPEVIAALNRGETVDPSRYYFRTAIRFRTTAPGLQFLNGLITLGTGQRLPDRVIITMFEVT